MNTVGDPRGLQTTIIGGVVPRVWLFDWVSRVPAVSGIVRMATWGVFTERLRARVTEGQHPVCFFLGAAGVEGTRG